MPPGKQGSRRSKEDTWKEDELKQSLKQIADDGRRGKQADDDKRRRRSTHSTAEKENHRSDQRVKPGRDAEKERISTGSEDRRRKEDDDDRRERKRRERDEHGDRRKETEEGRSEGRGRHEMDERRKETEEERRERKRKERDDGAERRKETEEERRERKRRERNETDDRRLETEAERKERKRRERDENGDRRQETEEERRERKRRERNETGDRRQETESERRERKRREREENGDRRKETEEERRERKRRERNETIDRRRETEEERRERKKRERLIDNDRRDEPEEEKRERRKEKDSIDEVRRGRKDTEMKDDRDVSKKHGKKSLHSAEEVTSKDEVKLVTSGHAGRGASTNGGHLDDSAADDHYEDDFENYEDDFEGSQISDSDREKATNVADVYDEDGPDADVWRAVNQENKKLLLPKGHRASDSDSPPPGPARSRAPPGGRFINFVSAKQRTVSDRAAARVKQRYRALRKLIDLDYVSYDIFDMPPVSEYDRYILDYGRSNTKQAYVQTNEDATDQELQTDDIDTREKWTQLPSDDNVGCGGGDAGEVTQMQQTKVTDFLRLEKFVREAGRVMTILLEQNVSNSASSHSDHHPSTGFSDQIVKLRPPNALKDLPVMAASFSLSQSYQLITAHSTHFLDARHPLYECGVLYEWNLNQPSRPQRLLSVRSQPSCCCFSPSSSDIVFAGAADGSVVLWDLRESASNHRSVTLDDRSGHHNGVHSDPETWTIYAPSYSTAMVLGTEGHQSPVVAVCPLVSATDWGRQCLTSGQGNNKDLSFQLATLEQNSNIYIWVVGQLPEGDAGGSESDLGLAPGGRVRLIKSAHISVDGPGKGGALTATCMQLSACDASQFYVGTDVSCVIRAARHMSRGLVRVYQGATDAPSHVTSMDVSPFGEPAFLVTTSDGLIRLHKADQSAPAMTWEHVTRQPIRSVRWSRSRACVFYVMDDRGTLCVYDVTRDTGVPVIQEQTKLVGITCMELSCDFNATGLGSQGRRPQMVMCTDSGQMEVHTWSEALAKAELDETCQLAEFLERVC